MTTTHDHEPISLDLVREIIALACRAPSVHNTQPWAWRASDVGIELYADDDRRLAVSDPDRRMLVLSCGAALHHAVVAAAGLGLASTVSRFPEGPDSTLLARVVFSPHPARPEDLALLQALRDRRTDRRRFSSWPIPVARLHQLADLAQGGALNAAAIVADDDRFLLEDLISRADEAQRADDAVVQEQQRWIDRGPDDGLPSSVLPTPEALPEGESDVSDTPPNRYADEASPGAERLVVVRDAGWDLETSDGLIALSSADDDPAAWLAAGEALSNLWLNATLGGLSVVPLSQVIEVPETRSAFQHDVLRGGVPQMLVRVGWQASTRDALPPAPRREQSDVLR